MYQLSKDALDYIVQSKDELIELEKTLCQIPAPSHHEERRTEFCKNWLEANGAVGVTVDSAKNVVFPINAEGSDHLTLFAAHMDTVFPDLEPMPMREENGRLYCPGAGDDTGSVAILLMICKYLISREIKPENGFLVVFNTREETDQTGITEALGAYEGRIEEYYMVDGLYNQVVNLPVAFQRYKISISAQGGHAYLNFGNPSAIQCAAEIAAQIYELPLPEGGKSSYNVGLIEGGSVINAIAQNASLSVEARSERPANLEKLKSAILDIVERQRDKGIYQIEVKDIGRLPGRGNVDEAHQKRIDDKMREIFGYYLEGKTIFRSGAGDANIISNQGVPGVGFCAYKLVGAHTREEYVELDSLENALRATMTIVLSCL